MALFHRQFDIVGVKLAATDDDQILQATGDEQFAIFQESQIPGAQKRPLAGIFQVGPKARSVSSGRFQYPCGHARAGHPDFAHFVRCTSSQRFRIDDDNPGIVQGVATPTSVRTFCCWR